MKCRSVGGWYVVAAVVTLLLAFVGADEHNHMYEDHEEIVLWMNTVGPYHNRQETYAYFSLPFCVGAKQSINHYHETMSEALQGVELEFSGYEIDFKVHKRILQKQIVV
ncbi:AGAP004882-PA-like protein [Anopheles sinensis]|uniref:Transmembrane 9 superfamily member n=1 Tax=Anopheles sinensis TaxID=74873 RepID=A0A084VXI5_ANOSI|nr:AGAP004882-PA-like protein [Anopheles sinensis]